MPTSLHNPAHPHAITHTAVYQGGTFAIVDAESGRIWGRYETTGQMYGGNFLVVTNMDTGEQFQLDLRKFGMLPYDFKLPKSKKEREPQYEYIWDTRYYALLLRPDGKPVHAPQPFVTTDTVAARVDEYSAEWRKAHAHIFITSEQAISA